MKQELFKQFKKDLKKSKNSLIKKAKNKGLYENFGSKEIMSLNDKYSIYSISLYEDFGNELNKLFNEFKDFCYNFDDNSLKEVLK